MHHPCRSFSLVVAAAAVLLTAGAQIGLAQGNTGAVYVLTNQASNAIMVFHRDATGALTFAGSFATGGSGAGTGADPLGSQGSLVLNEDGRLLFAVNAGSNSVSIFAVSGDQLNLLNTAPSGGVMPVSVTVKHDLVYVLNAGGTPNISGFRIHPEANQLVALAGSTRNLPGGAGSAPAQVSFASSTDVIVVTEKNTNRIDTFEVDEDGSAQAGVSFPSNGATPFGFAFDHDSVAIVSDAAGGPGGTSALSSYEVDENGTLEAITPALGDTQKAACWVVVPQSGRFAYTSNTASGTISSYAITDGGHLALFDALAATPGGAPIDMALSNNSRFLYARNANGTVDGFRVGIGDGGLTPIGVTSGIPAGAQGIAAR
jgi:6-phosphogluconolactonase (cycloisomerase 2 family)